MSRLWYAYLSTEDPFSNLNYFKTTVKPNCLCGDTICAISAPDNGFNPSPFSENLQRYIKDALATGQMQPQHPYNATKYVYLKY